MSISTDASSDDGLFNGRTVAIILIIGVVCFAAVMALMAWSPDLARRDRAAANPYSPSSVGYAGIVDMLEADGRDVSVSRLRASIEAPRDRLMVITLDTSTAESSFEDLSISGPALIVLPKWRHITDPTKRSWDRDTSLVAEPAILSLLSVFDDNAKVIRLGNPGTLRTPFGRSSPDFEDNMQVITSDLLEPIISVDGGVLLSRMPDREIYILSDPDVLNNFGIARRENARFGLGLIDWLTRTRQMPVVFDATVHGFGRSSSLLKSVFDIPFLGATLVAFATMLMIGWTAAVRFGAPVREGRAIALGKQALADNTAALVAMTRRERRMASGYLSLTRRALARALGVPRTLGDAEMSALLTRMGKQSPTAGDWEALEHALSGPASNREDLRDKARAVWRWRKEITHGH